MDYQKLIVNIEKREMDLIKEACKLDKRTLASITRKAVLNEAKKILQEKNSNGTDK